MIPRALRDLRSRFEASRLSTKVLILTLVTSAVLLATLSWRLNQTYTELNLGALLRGLRDGAGSQAAAIDGRLELWKRLNATSSSDPRLVAFLGASAAGRQDPVVAASARAGLQRALGADAAFKSASLVDRNGMSVLATDPALDSAAVTGQSPYVRAALDGKTAASELTIGALAPSPSLFIAAPVASAGGPATGALVVRTDPAGLLSFASGSPLADQQVALLIDRNGIVVGYSGPQPEQVLYHNVGSPTRAELARLRASGAYGSQPLTPLQMPELRSRISSQDAGTSSVRYAPTGRAARVGFSRLRQEPWSVAVVMDEVAFAAPLRDFSLNALGFAVIAAVLVIGLTFTVVRILERTESESLHDDLTALPNRRFFDDILEREVSRAARTHRPLSVINIDLDHFKTVNDTYGHGQGDQVLQRFANLLVKQVRSIDLSARYGGEEFVVLLPDTDKEGAQLVAEKVRRAVEFMPVAPHDERQRSSRAHVSVSAGVASFPDDGPDATTVLRRADQAMYLAKSLGRNQVIAFGSAVALSTVSGDQDKINRLVRNANRATVEALAAAIDARDSYTHGHSRRVAELATIIGRELGLETGELDVLHLGALLHDVGKIGVSDAVLRKSGELSEQERRSVQDHPQIGYEMVQGVDFLRKVAPIILHHHENVDGTGYPQGLRADQIPLHARIVKVVDAFDAMTGRRTYRPAATPEWALGELRRNAGTQFDKEVVNAISSAHSKRLLTHILSLPAEAV
jgi:diguanylate cyclase (GGDEF)-like protein/putative nucleotidyltransferase with HDIG domain